MSDTNNTPKPETPKAIVTEKFRVKLNGVAVTMGISPKTGVLCVYAYEDATGYHSSGRFPQSAYASQWAFRAAVAPAVKAFIDHDTESANPKLSSKSRTASATMGETLDFEAPDPLVAALAAAKNISLDEAQRMVEESGLDR